MSPQHPPLVGFAGARSLPIAENSIVPQWQLLTARSWLSPNIKEISLIPRGATLANLRLSVLPFVIPTTENSLSGPGSLGTGVVGARAVIVLIPCDS
jgi:hypothetical protein